MRLRIREEGDTVVVKWKGGGKGHRKKIGDIRGEGNVKEGTSGQRWKRDGEWGIQKGRE